MKTDKKVLHQTLAIMPVYLVEFVIGLGLGWVPLIINQLKNSNSEFSLTDEECSWIPTLYYMARAVAPVLSAIFVDRVGRNRIIILAACVNFLIWPVILFTRSVIWHYITRLAFGTAVGMYDPIVSIYICENSSPEIRGTFSAIFIMFFYAGELLAFILATYLSYDNVAIVHSGIAMLAVLSTFLLKEPVQFLIMKEKIKKAEKNYDWLHGPDGKAEFEEIRQNVLEEKLRTSFIECSRIPAVRKSFRIVVIILCLMMFTGYSAINSFITMAFTESGYFTSNEFTMLFGLLQLICCCISSKIIEKFNRRALLLLTCATIAINQLGTAFLYYAQSIWHIPYFNWFVFVTLTTYSCIFGMLMHPLTAAIRGELLPQSVKAIGSAFSVGASSTSAFISTGMFLPIANKYGMEMNYLLFSIVSLILFIYVYFDLPETRGKSLVEIQKELRAK